MYKVVDGVKIPMTAEQEAEYKRYAAEREAYDKAHPPLPTIEEQVQTLRTDVDDLSYILAGKEAAHAQP